MRRLPLTVSPEISPHYWEPCAREQEESKRLLAVRNTTWQKTLGMDALCSSATTPETCIAPDANKSCHKTLWPSLVPWEHAGGHAGPGLKPIACVAGGNYVLGAEPPETSGEATRNTGRVPFDQNFRKFRFKIEWNRNFPEIHFENFGSPLEVVLFSGNFLFIWHFYLVWIGPSSFSREKLQDGGESFESTTLDAKWSALVRACSWSKTNSLGCDFLENMWTGRSEFSVVSSPGLHTLRREKFVSFCHKYQGRVEFWMRVKLLHMKQLNTALKTTTSSRSFSSFSNYSWWEMCWKRE